MTFWKPGTAGPGAGTDLSRASESDRELLPYLYNPRHSLPLSQQRAALPIARHRLFHINTCSPSFPFRCLCLSASFLCLLVMFLT